MASKSKTLLAQELYDKLLGTPNRLYTPADRQDFFALFDGLKIPLIKQNKKREKRVIEYLNIPGSYDTETTSAYKCEETGEVITNEEAKARLQQATTGNSVKLFSKICWTYAWMVNICGVTMMGRHWSEFEQFVNELSARWNLHSNRRLVLYVHNLGFDFEFLRKHMDWEEVFVLDKLAPVKAIAKNGIELRCSYKLTNCKLEELGEKLSIYKQFAKLVGALDYNKIRTPVTRLTAEEIGYCVADVDTLTAYVMETMLQDGNITKISMTATGYVRRYCRKHCLKAGTHDDAENKARLRYQSIIKATKLTMQEYRMATEAFAGGYTHASIMYSGEILECVTSYDYTSFYPTIMVAFPWFPTGKGEKVVIKSKHQFEKLVAEKACLFCAKFYDIKSTSYMEHIISASKCVELVGAKTENGRVISADMLTIYMTDVDYRTYKNWYDWDGGMQISDMYVYNRGYLPKELVECILKFYSDKTTLKGVVDRIDDYIRAKGLLNSTYGMMVTAIIRNVLRYVEAENCWEEMPDFEGWSVEKIKDYKDACEAEAADELDKYNESETRFLSYLWGVWVTSIGRYIVTCFGIKQFGDDYCYCDTDSAKLLRAHLYQDKIQAYNDYITTMLREACDYHGIDFALTRPCNIKGVEKPLGVWDCEGTWKRAKFIRAKCYAVQTADDEIIVTVSGLNKRTATPYLLRKAGVKFHGLEKDGKTRIADDELDEAIWTGRAQHYIADSDTLQFFELFEDDEYHTLEVPAPWAGTTTHTYISNEMNATVVDYQCNTCEIVELSGVHIEQSTYGMCIPVEYLAARMECREYAD